jgi:Asp/Glu/hydantoin racemase
MRLLVLNPNTSASVTDRVAGTARGVAAPGTEIVAMTATRGVPYIATPAEALIGAAVAIETLAEHATGFDAAVIAAFADPGLGAARELLSIPVTGLAESAMLTACMLGRRFSIVAFTPALGPLFRECLDYNGLAARCASVRFVTRPFANIASVHDEQEDAVATLAAEAAQEDGADVVLLAGSPLTGLAARIADRVPVPVLDPVSPAIKHAEALVALAPRKARLGTHGRPEPKPSTGLPPALADRLARRP